MTAPGPRPGRCSACEAALAPGEPVCAGCGSPVFSAQRRVVTLLFADLSGYTTLCASLDPEEVHLLVRPLMNGLRRVCADLGAVVPMIEGDGFMAVFGALHSDEEDPARAVSAAARLQRVVAERRAAYGDRLPQLRVGLNAGEVLVAPSWEHGGFSLSGDAVNVASRLCEIAAPGSVLVGTELVALVPGVAWGAPRQRALRNRDEPVLAFELDWVTADPSPAGRRLSSDVPLVGRDAELVSLTQAGSHVGPWAWVLVGEPGVGKTRLAEEALRRLDRRQVVGRCPSPASAAPPAAPFADLVRSLRDGLDLSPLTRRRIGRLLGEASEEVASTEVDTEDEQLAAAVSILVAASDVEPLVILMDDLHNASAATLRAVGLLATSCGPRLALLATARQEPAEALGLQALPVEPLEGPATAALVHRLLPGASPDLVTFLEGRSGGVPLYVEQCAQLMLEEGIVELSGAGCRLRDPAGLRRVPTVMRLFVAARVDLLEPDEATCISAAAVLGDTVDAELLAHLVPGAGDGVERLVERGLLRWDGSGGPPQLRFRHALVRDVVYDGLLRRTRIALHERAAEWYARRAGSLALAATALHLELALALEPPGGADETLRHRTAQALVALGDAICEEQPAHAVDALVRAGRLLGDGSALGDVVDHNLALGHALELTGDEAAAARHAASARAGAVELGDRQREARATLLEAQARAGQGQDSSALLAQARALFAEAGDTVGLARVAVERAIVAEASDGIPGRLAAYEAAFSAAALSGDGGLVAVAAQQLAVHSFVVGRRATRRWQAIAVGVQRPGDAQGRARLALGRCLADLHAYDLSAARADASLAGRLGEELGAAQVVLNAGLVALEAAVLLGDAGAEDAFARCLALAESRPTDRLLCSTLLFGALLRNRQGDGAGSAALLAHAGELVPGLGAAYERERAAVRAQLHLDAGRWEAAAAEARAAARLDAALGQPFLALRPRLVAAVAETAAGRRAADDPAADALRLGAEPLAELTGAWLRRADPAPAPAAEENVEGTALAREAAGDWAGAAREWERLGYTVWLARALERVGSPEAGERAREVREVLEAGVPA